MVKLRKISFLLPAIALLFVFLLPSSVNAAKFETGDYNLDKQSVVEDDLYIAGDNITISGVVDGDVLAAGQNITVDGTVTGNLYIAGNNVTINGNIYGNTMLAGSIINIDGTLGGDVIAAAYSVISSGDINKDLIIFAGTSKVSGDIGDDIRAVSGDITSEANVGGDFVFVGDKYTVDEATVNGDIIHKITKSTEETKTTYFNGFDLGLSLISFIGMFIVGAVLIYLAPVKTLQIEKKISTSWEEALKSFAIGLLILFAIPLPLFFLAITLVGAPLAFLITGLLIFLTTLGVVWTEIAIGDVVLKEIFKKKDDKKYLSLLVGRFISVIIKLIPIIGAIYSFVLMATTVGAVFRIKRLALTNASKK